MSKLAPLISIKGTDYYYKNMLCLHFKPCITDSDKYLMNRKEKCVIPTKTY